jgi:cytochrome c-type biogenesis protein CcmH/NrfF
MSVSKNSLFACILVAAFGAAAFGQSASELDSPAVLRVADQFRCTCGCNLTMACKMEGGCHICKGAKAQIFAMQASGKTDGQIVDAFVQENGKDVLAIRPGPMGVIGPWAMLGLGAILVVFLIRRFAVAKTAPATAGAAIGSEELDRYHAQIEKDLEKLE